MIDEVTCEERIQIDFRELGEEIGNLVGEKQIAYGDSFGKSGKIIEILYEDGITVAKMDDALTLLRIIDKMFRIATNKDAFGEDPFMDIAGYALLACKRNRDKKRTSGT